MFQSFQDDLLEVAVGEQAELIIEEAEERTIQHQLGIELSKKT